jgi:phosphoribosylanthranilate isomerase
MMKIKVCGITNVEDALDTIEAGADMLGFNFFPDSLRFIDRAVCRKICSILAEIAPHVIRIGVFVNVPTSEVKDILQGCNLHLAQFSGDEPMAELLAMEGQAFKAVRPSASFDIDAYLAVRGNESPVCLADSAVVGQFGGTGKTADWNWAASLARRASILLAGGLRPENVAEAIRQVQPWGVDVASGVEIIPGRKDPLRVRQFIRNARSVILPYTDMESIG